MCTEQSVRGSSGESKLRRREEYDWTYRTLYGGEVKVGTEHAGCSAASVARWESFRPIHCHDASCAATPSLATASTAAADPELAASCSWMPMPPDDGSSAACWGELGAVQLEEHVKLYEDYLHDLGITSLVVRFRQHEAGWEVRLRWWACVNPTNRSQRGVPHARLRDTTIRSAPDGVLQRRTVEKQLYIEPSFVKDTAIRYDPSFV